MNRQPFHVLSQEWRYFSREKSLIHTLHLSQLVDGNAGETVIIDATSPVDNSTTGGSYHIPSLNLPDFGNVGKGGHNVVFNKAIMSPCFGCVAWDRTVLAQRNMSVTTSPWDATQMTIAMIPHEAGWFMIHIEAQSDLRGSPYNYQGPTGDGRMVATLSKKAGTPSLIAAANQLFMGGLFDASNWRPTMFITSIVTGRANIMLPLGKDEPIYFGGQMGDITQASLAMWMFKFAEV